MSEKIAVYSTYVVSEPVSFTKKIAHRRSNSPLNTLRVHSKTAVSQTAKEGLGLPSITVTGRRLVRLRPFARTTSSTKKCSGAKGQLRQILFILNINQV